MHAREWSPERFRLKMVEAGSVNYESHPRVQTTSLTEIAAAAT